MTPEELWTWADEWAREYERRHGTTEYPTIGQAATRFRVSREHVRDAIEDYQGPHYLGLAVAHGNPGGGRATYYRVPRVEAYP